MRPKIVINCLFLFGKINFSLHISFLVLYAKPICLLTEININKLILMLQKNTIYNLAVNISHQKHWSFSYINIVTSLILLKRLSQRGYLYLKDSFSIKKKRKDCSIFMLHIMGCVYTTKEELVFHSMLFPCHHQYSLFISMFFLQNILPTHSGSFFILWFIAPWQLCLEETGFSFLFVFATQLMFYIF